jgi:hypothetical protein
MRMHTCTNLLRSSGQCCRSHQSDLERTVPMCQMVQHICGQGSAISAQRAALNAQPWCSHGVIMAASVLYLLPTSQVDSLRMP